MTMWLNLLAEAAPPQPAGGGGDGGLLPLLITFGPFLVIFFVLNHLLIARPAAREQERHRDLLANLKKNDRVYTSSGIIGSFVSISDDRREITLKVDDNTRLRVLAETVRGRMEPGGGEGGEAAKSPA